MKAIKLQVTTATQDYPIIIGKNIFNKLNRLLRENSISFNQCLVVLDTNIPKKITNEILNFLPKKK